MEVAVEEEVEAEEEVEEEEEIEDLIDKEIIESPMEEVEVSVLINKMLKMITQANKHND